MASLFRYLNVLLTEKKELSFHSIEVSRIACEFGIFLGLERNDIHHLRIGGLLHDIGKIEIPKEILYKSEPLSDEEFRLIKEHSLKGYEILKRTKHPFSQDVLDIVLQHHERVDGFGYPFQLKDEEIHPLAKIVSLCDVYSAMTSARSYREPISHENTLDEIQRGLGIQFDIEIGERFIVFMKEKMKKQGIARPERFETNE